MRREVAEVAKSADLEHIRVYFRLKEKKKPRSFTLTSIIATKQQPI